jgi:hypothetical protein
MSSIERNETPLYRRSMQIRPFFVVRLSVTIIGGAMDFRHCVGKSVGDNIDRAISSSRKNNDVTDITLLNGALCPGA